MTHNDQPTRERGKKSRCNIGQLSSWEYEPSAVRHPATHSRVLFTLRQTERLYSQPTLLPFLTSHR